jgi:hypothetical protein
MSHEDRQMSSSPPPPPPLRGEEIEEYVTIDNFEGLFCLLCWYCTAFIEGLPYPFERHFSQDVQRYYIFNPETNECWWEDEMEGGFELENNAKKKKTSFFDFSNQNLTFFCKTC